MIEVENIRLKFSKNFAPKRGSRLSIPPVTRHNRTASQNATMNRTLVEKARAMLIDSQLPKEFWGYEICTANYLINGTPAEVFYGTHE